MPHQADTLFSPTFPYCDVKLAPYVFAPREAEQLLEQAGWKRVADTPSRAKDGKELAIDLAYVGGDPVMKSIAEVVQSDLRKVGIRVAPLGEEEDSYNNRQKTGEYGIIYNETWGAPYDPHSYVSSMRAPRHADYQAQLGLPMKAEIDAKIGEVLVTTDQAKRRQIYKEILATLHEHAVYLPISYQVGILVHREVLTGVAYGATQYEIPFGKTGRKQ